MFGARPRVPGLLRRATTRSTLSDSAAGAQGNL